MSMNDKEVKDKVNAWFDSSPYKSKIPSMPYTIRYELYQRYVAKTPLTQEEVRRSMPKEPEIEGEPTPLSQVKVGEKVKIKVLASGTIRDSSYRGCKDCFKKIADEDDECQNPSCNHLTGEIVDFRSKSLKVVDATGKDESESVISVKISPWQIDEIESEYGDLSGKILTLQGRYEMKEGKSKKGKSFESFDFNITRLLSVEDPWDESKEIPKDVPSATETPKSDDEPKETEKPSKPSGGMDAYQSSVKFIRAGMKSLDGREVEQLKVRKILHEKFNQLSDEDFNVLMARLVKSGILEENNVANTYKLNLKAKGE